MDRFVKTFPFAVLMGGLVLSALPQRALAQDTSQDPSQAGAQAQPSNDQSQDQQESRKDEKRARKAKQKSDSELKKELDSQYKTWLDQDVVYIITPEERHTFLHLTTNEEREQFIEAFWQRRNPDPDSAENTFKEEHYRRIAYANEHYASGIPGWKTDRGKIYIMWGPPDEVDAHPTGGTWDRPMDQGGGETTTYAYEDWRYRYLEGMGENVELEFVDPSGTGEYHLTTDPSEKDALLRVPGAGLTLAESMGMADKSSRFSNTDGTNVAEGQMGANMQSESMNEFTRLELEANIFRPPPVKFKDLEALSTSRIIRDQVKFDYRYDFLRITSDTVLVPITVQIPVRQLSFQEKDGVDTANMNIFARVTSLGGRVIQTFEDPLRTDIPSSLLQSSLGTSRIYQKAVPLAPGLYRLDIVIKDINSGNVGVVNARLDVPRFDDDQLSNSSLILADDIQSVSSKDIGLGQFVLGDLKVRPKLDQTFTPDDRMGIFVQIYNLKVDDKTHKADASVEFRVTKDEKGATEPMLKYDLPADQIPEHGEEMTLAKQLTLGSLAPGKYKLEVAVTDNVSKQTITPTTEFTVKPVPASEKQGR
ncbi:MAG TPA: GWxTD domain-containing protein [Candidatus Acidoferrales bacterium]|nr:GWxTD domain-containing protein [Candidatus Acidoferrales bacterium]